MTKKLVAISLAIALVITLGLAPVAYAAKPAPIMLAGVDIKTVSGTFTWDALVAGTVEKVDSFNAETLGDWGGEYRDGAVTAFPGDADDAGYITFTWEEGKARRIVLRVLDGIADDSFNVYVMNPDGNWVRAYSYTSDPSIDEVWEVHHVYGFPAGKGQGPSIEMKIEPTSVGWSGFDTWGQLAVDYVKVYDH